VKETVERCLHLDVASLRQALDADGPVTGRLAWGDPGGGPEAALEFSVEPLGDGQALLRLGYVLGSAENGQDVEETIVLIATPQFRGRRWSFRCPLERDGQACSRTARILYLPPNQRYFGCRQCFDLSYLSRQQRPDPLSVQDLTGDPSHLAGTPVALPGRPVAACQPGQMVVAGMAT
jgi:hypothetical protein